MATRWRVLNRRRRRKTQQLEYTHAYYCEHQWLETYYRTECKKCEAFYAGVFNGIDPAFWDDHEADDYEYDEDYEADCGFCGGDGWIDGYEDDPIFFAPWEMQRCPSCYGTGRAKDMTIW